jgi:hypothetical protein
VSPHVLISQQLDQLEHPDHPPYFGALVERQIVNLFTSGKIDAEEFHNYCERFRRLAGRNVRSAA